MRKDISGSRPTIVETLMVLALTLACHYVNKCITLALIPLLANHYDITTLSINVKVVVGVFCSVDRLIYTSALDKM